ncbi:SRPBCC family protein [Kribbella sancticallisti]|uniref:SRPBCC family protein n=1 Tax=Kribbella sancticallisti TaxID=460087 RepID=A0ABN2CWF0_9ACTN
MPTNSLHQAKTRSVSIAASPQAVFDLVTDPAALPRWAPGVARSVRVDGDDWILENAQGETRVTLRTSPDHGTVDLLIAENQGVFTRVLPNGEGSEYQFTMLLPADLPDEAVAEQMTIVEAELEAVRTLCEAVREPAPEQSRGDQRQ